MFWVRQQHSPPPDIQFYINVSSSLCSTFLTFYFFCSLIFISILSALISRKILEFLFCFRDFIYFQYPIYYSSYTSWFLLDTYVFHLYRYHPDFRTSRLLILDSYMQINSRHIDNTVGIIEFFSPTFLRQICFLGKHLLWFFIVVTYIRLKHIKFLVFQSFLNL